MLLCRRRGGIDNYTGKGGRHHPNRGGRSRRRVYLRLLEKEDRRTFCRGRKREDSIPTTLRRGEKRVDPLIEKKDRKPKMVLRNGERKRSHLIKKKLPISLDGKRGEKENTI